MCFESVSISSNSTDANQDLKCPFQPEPLTMASAVFFLDLKGKTLLARNYRGDIPLSAVEKFPILLGQAEEESSAVPPCFSDEGINVRCSKSKHSTSKSLLTEHSTSISDTTIYTS